MHSTYALVCCGHRNCIKEGKSVEEAYWELVIKDIQDACDLFLPLYQKSGAIDGYISVEVSPLLANETQATIDSAKYLHQRVNRPNVLIKIPATLECIESIKQVIASSISVNVTVSVCFHISGTYLHWGCYLHPCKWLVGQSQFSRRLGYKQEWCYFQVVLRCDVEARTSKFPFIMILDAFVQPCFWCVFFLLQLIFSLARYEAVIDAYLAGLEAVEGDLSKIASVASFFVSRVDALVDKKLNAIGTKEALELKGKVLQSPCSL